MSARVSTVVQPTRTVTTVDQDGARHRHESSRGHEALALSLLYGVDGAAERMGISPQTVKGHLTTLYRRLGVEGSKGSAARAAFRLGWLVIPDEVLARAGGER